MIAMTRTRTIDIHAHILPQETVRRLGAEAPGLAPKLIPQGDGATVMEIAGKVVQRPMPRECSDLDLRLADMDRHGIDMQAVCATVHTFFYYPFDMGERDGVARVEALPIPRAHRDAVLGRRATELLRNGRP